jgi:uncharacterized protein with GYD domain
MPIHVGLVNWTDQGIKEFRGSVERANGFRHLVEQAGGQVREMVWTMGEYDFITVFQAPDDESAAALVLRVAAAGNVHTKTMRAFDADQMTDIIARQAERQLVRGSGSAGDRSATQALSADRQCPLLSLILGWDVTPI